MLEVVEINRIADLDSHQLAWNSLYQQTRNASFFQSLDWVRTYFHYYGAEQRPRIMLVSHRGSVVGIMPLTVLRESTRLGAMRVLTYPLHDWGSFYGPIGPNAAVTLLAVMRYLRRQPRDFDLLDLRWVDKEETDFGRTPTAMQRAGFAVTQDKWKTTAMLHLATRWPGGWEEFFSGCGRKFRNSLRRAEKRLAQCGEVVFERRRMEGAATGDEDPCWRLYDDCVALARRSWQGASTTGTTLSHTGVREFLRETHKLAVRLGAVDLNLLRLDGQPIAFAYNYHCRGRIFGLRAGYHPDFAEFAPGNVLIARMIRDSFARGDKVLDMGPGSMEIKRRWQAQEASSYRYTVYPLAAPRVQMLRVGRFLCAKSENASIWPVGKRAGPENI